MDFGSDFGFAYIADVLAYYTFGKNEDWLSILKSIKSNNDISDLSKRAFNLITKLNQYSKVLEKQEDKEMDI